MDVVDTPESRRLGLGGRDSLGSDRGMWFVFDNPSEAMFWMKGMHFPIDIVWVTDNLVVAGVSPDLPHTATGTPDSNLPRYRSPGTVRYVLEINAGKAAELGITEGDSVTVESR